MKQDNIILGSGRVYIAALSSGEIPDTIESSGNLFGFTKGGATLTYNTEFTDISDDNGDVKKTFLESDSCELKLGAFVDKEGIGTQIQKICPTAQLSTGTTAIGTSTVNCSFVRIGGVANGNNQDWAVRFVHATEPLKVDIVGKNTNGLELSFSPDDATVIEPTFTCAAMSTSIGNGVLARITYGYTQS